jgi:hypothetical protein
MRNTIMTPSPLKRESFSSSYDSNCGPISMSGSFESSFGSSASAATSWDQCHTPSSQHFTLSRRQSSGSIDMDMLSSSRSSLTGSISPSEHMFFPMTSMGSMPQNMLTSMPSNDSNFLSTPSGKAVMNANMMNYDFTDVNTIYRPLEMQDFMHDGLPALSFDSSSPLPMGSSPAHYVDPSQTTFEPLCPSTPINIRSTSFSSPLDNYGSGSQHTPTYFQHFMSPPNAFTPTHSSPLSIKSESTLRRTPSLSAALELSSAALHRVQSTGSSGRIHKPLRNSKLDIVAAGLFHCDVKGCKSQKGFRRQEHLKRHKKTHYNQKDLNCEFCPKAFQLDRTDNYRSHVRLHAKVGNKGTRTKYFPKADEMVRRWDEEKERKNGNEKLNSLMSQSVGSRSTRRSTTLQSSPDLDLSL